MAEPLIYDVARHFLLLIAQAWELPPDQLCHYPDGPREMAHHFLKVELTLTYAQVAGLLDTSDTFAQNAIKRGEHLYTSWPVYQQRYDEVHTQAIEWLCISV